MNARGSQYALGGTVEGWARLSDLTRKQTTVLRSAYRGLNPRVYSRYGRRQWAAPLPWVQVIVKDPFATLSLPVIVDATGALPVLVYRHPGAVLASYRRMGWCPDLRELQHLESLVPDPATVTDGPEDLRRVTRMWAVLHNLALADLASMPEAILVSHEDLASGGAQAMAHLARGCGIRARRSTTAQVSPSSGARPSATTTRLHNLDRDPRDVAAAWRSQIAEDEVELIERSACAIMGELHRRRLTVVR